jgi:hypothetical protein
MWFIIILLVLDYNLLLLLSTLKQSGYCMYRCNIEGWKFAHTIYVYFGPFSESTKLICLKIINKFIFVLETQYIYY